MGHAEPISAVLIALDEEARIADALHSVGWAEEILVVDGGSRDGTVRLCRQQGARVLHRPFTTYTEQKNHGLEQARHDWVLSLDADERVTETLRDEIQALRRSGFEAQGYRMPRVSYYLGRWIRTTAWYPDRQLRLFDRRHGRWQGLYVHESVRVNGTVHTLRGEILHYSYESLSDHVEKLNRYAELAARQMWETGKRGGLLRALATPAFVFLKNWLVKGGWKEGSVGLTISVMNAFYVYLKYMKLWERGRPPGV